MITNHSRRAFLGGTAATAAAALSCIDRADAALAAKAPRATAAGASWRQVFGTEPGLARLHKNENPYGPSPRVQQAIRDSASRAAYYATTRYLRDMLAERYRVDQAQVLVSSGSVESLTAAAVAWGQAGAIVCAELCWDDPLYYTETKGTSIRRVALDQDLRVNLAKLEAALDDGVSMIHLCNPNNPTGLVQDPAELEAFCRRLSRRATILVDEAYNELTDDPERHSMIGLVREGLDVIVSRTFSKIYGMAGMRVGYMLSTPQNIERISRHKMCWVAAPSVAAAIAALDDGAFLAQSKSKILEARDMVVSAFDAAGLRYLRSQANFVYADVVGDASAFEQGMLQRGILVHAVYRDYTRWSRVSMGHLRDVERYVSALPEVLAAGRTKGQPS